MRGIFVTGTDTGIGKTIVTGLLAKFLDDQGYEVITQKWVETGTLGFSKDISLHLKLLGRRKKDLKSYLNDMSLYTFKFPSSPHLGSKLEKKKINIEKIKKSFKFLIKEFDYVIVEGVGGALVPLNKKKLVIDLAKDLNLPALIVVGNKLGAINHTLLTIEALRARKIRILGVIFNNLGNKGSKIILKDNPKIIEAISGVKSLGSLLWTKDKDLLYESFKKIGKKILSNLK
ncbi:MAG: dethiobiotin synthase [Candidatus Omnitrophica bacterium]|nr:dethiobiotin synthase [Candidatus Omnitrophota bacterium]